MSSERTIDVDDVGKITTPGDPGGPVSLASDRLAGRYTIGPLIGRGGSGQVHRARDHLTGADVAVKFVRPHGPGVTRQIRRELTALRVLELPGVIRLRDDGWMLGQRFLVMDLLEGGPFDVLATRGGWETWRAQALTLLATLARVHFAGVVHRDLKPQNILLDTRDQPVITDFGLAQGAVVDDSSGSREGTPRFMAPEQARGEPCDARADLYALGVMFDDMVAHDRAGTPDDVRAVFRAMRSTEPADRPASALEALAALDGSVEAVFGSVEGLPDPATETDLRQLFDEPQVSFLHLAEDAASVLWDRTAGSRELVRSELEAWVRAGRCHWAARNRLTIERAAVDRLRWEGSADARRLAALALTSASGGSGDPDPFVDEALGVASALVRAGRVERAMGVVDVALASVDPGSVHRRALLERLVCTAVSLATHDALHLAHHRAERLEAADLADLVAGVRSLNSGAADRAVEQLSNPLSGEPELSRIPSLVLALGNRDPARTDALLADAERLCRGDRLREGRRQVWCGNAAYARGDYARAYAHHEAAIRMLDRFPAAQLPARVNAGHAALELFALDRVADHAREARALAASLRHPHAEALATWLLRAAAYRAGEPLTCRPELVDAARVVSTRLMAQFAVYEAAIAYRAGDRATARALALDAASGTAAVLARALARAAGHVDGLGAGDTSIEADVAALDALPVAMRLQAVALLAEAGIAPPPVDTLHAWASRWPAPDDQQRMDVLSLAECGARLGVRFVHPGVPREAS